MASPDLTKLSLEELNTVIDEATKLRDGKIGEKRQELLAELQKLDALSGKSAPAQKVSRARASPDPKYRSAQNPALTWAGRGGQPKWLTAEIAETGKKLEDFAIKA